MMTMMTIPIDNDNVNEESTPPIDVDNENVKFIPTLVKNENNKFTPSINDDNNDDNNDDILAAPPIHHNDNDEAAPPIQALLDQLEDVMMAEIHDGVVSTNTLASYIKDIMELVTWMKRNDLTWLTSHGWQ